MLKRPETPMCPSDAAPPPQSARLCPPLCVTDDATFWPWLKWTDFARRTDQAATLVVVPIAGMSDWGLGHALDLEEVLALSVLKDAAARVTPEAGFRVLTLPPLRFASGPAAACAFPAEPPLVHRLIEEIVAGVAASGFSRIVLYNASPWNEDLIDVAARDLRIARGLQMFCVNLSALGFDLHPTRGTTRRAAQTLGTYLLQTEPEPASTFPPMPAHAPTGESALRWPEEDRVEALEGPAASLAEARRTGPALLSAAGARLHALLGEIAARPPLAHAGAIRPMRP